MVRVGNQGRSRAAARGFGAISIALLLVGFLTSCNLATLNGSTAPADVDVLDKVRSTDIMPRQPEIVGGVQNNGGQRAKAAVYEGTEVTDIGDSRLAT
jgi:general secretion pathway protein D